MEPPEKQGAPWGEVEGGWNLQRNREHPGVRWREGGTSRENREHPGVRWREGATSRETGSTLG